ncbi:MFS transporter [Hoeflea prorocentri]|uniref:MFS transporter n=1 Tax=Hoeflea prorocentri TaxID=1922333 RepID=A0A9X3UL49_9HYPH|nr:MFS transporter [Hoeflea prorocentri]MCY6383268.1 MFS transporter [Hoeflea prorocentri]MDA5401068.1 MFS transporter [Hoeflea prorocentri]
MQDNKWGVLCTIGFALVLTLSTWFSATAVATELQHALDMTAGQIAWMTNGVQLGFVTGALLASFFSIADVWPMTRVLAIGAVAAGLANASLLLEPGAGFAIAARFITGASLALVYPTAMKFIGTWFKTGRGLAMGAVVGALTLGSASPHLIRALEVGFDWRLIIAITSVACFVSVLIFLTLKEGPYPFKSAQFSPGQIRAVVRNRPAMLANFGYFGHMWELYAFWGWLLAFVAAAQLSGLDLRNASLLTFAAIAMGAPGCILAGWLADRIGRCLTAALCMAISGTCAVLIGFVYAGPAMLFVAIALVWGFTTVADSAQFSAAVSEVADPTLVGSSLAFQMGVGFAITIFTIWLMPQIAEAIGSWRWTFLFLAPGPFLGVLAMLSLRAHPEAIRIANGKR